MQLPHWLSMLTMVVLMRCGESLKFSNNKYEDLLVAINPRVTPDATVIKELINMFKEASPYLHRATRNRAYFGSIKILVPDTWPSDPSYSAATTETFEDADIRVDSEHPSHGSDPYTFQPGQCGEPGRYIHLTPGYITDEHHDREINYGNMGRTLVHEFAHLRYGVFDEYGLGTPEYPDTYLDQNTLFPTMCSSNHTRGHYSAGEQGNCSIDPVTNLPVAECFFLPDLDSNTAPASVMYDTMINKVTQFCESNTDDPDLLHNHLAPNLHNRMCDGKGTWDVIKEHSDFKGGNLPGNRTNEELRPSITLLYPARSLPTNGSQSHSGSCGRPVVLVLDVSGSMTSNNRYFKQTQTADKLIRDVLPTGTKVGVVKFSSTAQEVVPLTTLLTSSDRDRVSTNLPDENEYFGATAIGLGLLEGKRMLEEAGEASNGRIVLITDGGENVTPYVTEVKGEIIAAGIRVHSVAYSFAAATSIRELAVKTGGEYAFYSENPTSSILDSIVQSLLTDISVCSEMERIEITRRALVMVPNNEVVRYVTIDSTANNDTVFVFTLPLGVTVNVILTSPSGINFTSHSTESSFDAHLNILRFHFDKTETGEWTCSLKPAGSGTVTLVVKSLPTEDPYAVEAWMSSTLTDLSLGSKHVIVYVYVHKGYGPVIYADVTVKVERPGASSVNLKPRDDGKFADTMANDGVYSSYFTQYTGNQRYSLDVEVKSIYGRTVFLNVATYGGARSRYHNTTKPPVAVPAENFTRTGSPGAMDVTGYVAGADNFPPSTITDLRVVSTDRNLRQVTLTWTAPGDDLDVGNASRYDIRMSKTAHDIIPDFGSKPKVSPSMIKSGSLTPGIVGSTETLTVQIPANWTTVLFAIQTSDDAGHSSDVSRPVTSTFDEVKLKGHTTTTMTTSTSTTTTTPDGVTASPVKNDNSNDVLIISCVTAGLVCAMLISGVTYMVIKYQKSKLLSKTNPFTAEMTEPSVPNVRFTYSGRDIPL